MYAFQFVGLGYEQILAETRYIFRRARFRKVQTLQLQ